MRIALRITGAVLSLALLFAGYHAIRAGSLWPGDIWDSVTGAQPDPEPAQPGILPGEQPDFESLPVLRAWVDVQGDVVRVRQELVLGEKLEAFTGWINSLQFADTRVLGVSSPEGIESFSLSDMTLTARFAQPSDRLELEYELTLSHTVEMLSWSEDQILLCNFLITPEATRNGQPIELYQSAFGDPYVYEASNYEVTVTADSAYTMLAAGLVQEKREDGRTTSLFCGPGLRDFSVVLMKDFKLTVTSYNGVNVYYADAEVAQPFVQEALRFAGEKIGPYPYRDLFIIAAPIGRNQGMEMSNLILITPQSFASLDTLKALTYHEVLHQWFYLLIGTDQLNEPFVDEGMVAFLTNQMCLLPTPTAHNTGFIGKAIKDYASESDYRAGAYVQSARYMSALYERVGEHRFYAALKRMYAEQAGRILYFDTFIKYFSE